MEVYTKSDNCQYDFFEKIDSPDKSYFLGLLYADGCIREYKNVPKQAILRLNESDKYILEKLKFSITGNADLYFFNHKAKNSNHSNAFGFEIRSQKLATDLVNLGCFPKKSLSLEFPTEEQVPKNLLSHFIRGYFDGDGSIYKCFGGRHINPQFQIKIVGTENFCRSISKYINEEIGIGEKKIRREKNIFLYNFGGNELVKKFYHFLYRDANTFLYRKKDKFKELFTLIPYKAKKRAPN
jgi:hypothetical protein